MTGITLSLRIDHLTRQRFTRYLNFVLCIMFPCCWPFEFWVKFRDRISSGGGDRSPNPLTPKTLYQIESHFYYVDSSVQEVIKKNFYIHSFWYSHSTHFIVFFTFSFFGIGIILRLTMKISLFDRLINICWPCFHVWVFIWPVLMSRRLQSLAIDSWPLF